MKIAKLFQNGQSQAVRLPKEFRFEGNEAYIKKIGNVVLLMPINHPWNGLIDSLHKFSNDFMENRNQPQQQVRDDLFE